MNSNFEALRAKRSESQSNNSGEYPEAWRPEAGNEIAGTFVEWQTSESSGRSCRIAVVEDEQEKHWSVWMWHKVLRDELEKVGPLPGDFLLITRGEETPLKNGGSYFAYDVQHAKAEIQIEPPEDQRAVDEHAPF